MSNGDPVLERVLLSARILNDIAVSLRAAAVVYRHADQQLYGGTSEVLSTIADKMELRAEANLEEAEEMAR